MAGKEPVPEWLPPGWKVEVKARRNGVKDRTYFHPTNGLTFRSKNEVLRYINTPDTFAEKATPESDPTKLKAKQNNSVESLPEGWIVESKLRRNGVLAGRSDKYFIETSTGYKFNSMTRVQNYLNAKHRKMSSTEHSIEKPASDTRGRRLRQIRPKQSLFEEQISNSNPSAKVDDEFTSHNNPDSGLNDPGSSAHLEKDANKLTVEQVDENEECKDAKPPKETVIQELSITMPPEGSVKEADPNQVFDMNGVVNENANHSELQLTHLKDDLPVEKKRYKQLVSKSKRKQDCHQNEGKVRKAFQSVPRRSGRLAALKDVVNSNFEVISEQTNSILTTKPSLKGFSNGELLKEVTNAETSSKSKRQVSEDEKNKANCQLQPSFTDIWSDPCIEFAFKTLTDIIPVECIPPNVWLSPSAAAVKLQVSGGNQDVK